MIKVNTEGEASVAHLPITVESTRQVFDRLIAERGADYIYQRPSGADECLYFDPTEGGPSCIAGQVFAAHGYSEHDVTEYTGASEVLEELGIEDPILRRYLDTAQENQDSGVPWGEAVAAAERAIYTHPSTTEIEEVAA